MIVNIRVEGIDDLLQSFDSLFVSDFFNRSTGLNDQRNNKEVVDLLTGLLASLTVSTDKKVVNEETRQSWPALIKEGSSGSAGNLNYNSSLLAYLQSMKLANKVDCNSSVQALSSSDNSNFNHPCSCRLYADNSNQPKQVEPDTFYPPAKEAKVDAPGDKRGKQQMKAMAPIQTDNTKKSKGIDKETAKSILEHQTQNNNN